MKYVRNVLVALFLMPAVLFCDYTPEQLIDHVIAAINAADNFESKLNQNPAALQVEGMTGLKYRHLLNNLASLSGANYLEVGSWKGSTAIAALYGNGSTLRRAVIIDNFSEFQTDPIKETLFNNLNQFATGCNWSFYDHDCFSIDKDATFDTPIDIYFYDGHHSYESQKQAFTYFDDIFADVFIAIVDDYDWFGGVFGNVRKGTLDAFRELGYKILFMRELGNYPGDHHLGDSTNWWNGVFVAVVQKPTH